MAIYSDINSFPKTGFPVLADVSDRICLNTLYWNPLKSSGFVIDVIGNNRLSGSLTINGSMNGVGSLSMGGTLSGVTSLTMSGNLIMTSAVSEIGSIFGKIYKGWFKNLEITNVPTVNGEPLALISNLARYIPYTGSLANIDFGDKNVITTGTFGAGNSTVTGVLTVQNNTSVGVLIRRSTDSSPAVIIDTADLSSDFYGSINCLAGVVTAPYFQTSTAITANSTGTVAIVAKDSNLLTNNAGWLPVKKSDGTVVYIPYWA